MERLLKKAEEINKVDRDFDFILIGNIDNVLVNLPKSLHQAGFKVLVIGAGGMSLLRSPWIDSSIKLKGKSQTKFLMELFKLRDFLMSLSGTFLWCSDDIMREISLSDISLDFKYQLLPIRNSDYFEILGSKTGQYNVLETLKVNVPFSVVMQSAEDKNVKNLKSFKDQIIKGNLHGGGSCIKRVSKGSNLELNKLPTNWFPVVIQEFIDGALVAVEAYYKEGELLFWLYSEVDLDISLYGPSVSRTYSAASNLDFLPQLITLGKAAKIHGFANISLILDSSTQEHKIFELDLRPNIWHHTFSDFGIDFWTLWNLGGNFKPMTYFPNPVRKFDPDRLFNYFLSTWNVAGAWNVFMSKDLESFGSPISSSFDGSIGKSFRLFKLIIFPLVPLRQHLLKILIYIKRKLPKSLSHKIDNSFLKAFLLRVLTR